MNLFEYFVYRNRSRLYAILRIVSAFLFACHGAQKLLGLFGGNPTDNLELKIAGIIEFFGGMLISFGFKTRYAAFIAAGEMAAAYFSVHALRGFWPIKNGGELAILYCFLFLFFTAKGSGAWSIDSMLKKNKY